MKIFRNVFFMTVSFCYQYTHLIGFRRKRLRKILEHNILSFESPMSPTLEFSLNVFTELSEFSDKKKSKWGLQDWKPGSRVYHRDTGNRADPYTEPNACFSDFSDSLNSLNSIKVLLYLRKTPLSFRIQCEEDTRGKSELQRTDRHFTCSGVDRGESHERRGDTGRSFVPQ